MSRKAKPDGKKSKGNVTLLKVQKAVPAKSAASQTVKPVGQAAPAVTAISPAAWTIARLRAECNRWPLMLCGTPGTYYVGVGGDQDAGRQPHGEEIECLRASGRSEQVAALRRVGQKTHVPLAWVFYPDDVVLRLLPGAAGQEQMRIINLVRAAMPKEIKTRKLTHAVERASAEAFDRDVNAHITALPAVNDPHQIALADCKPLRGFAAGKPDRYLFREGEGVCNYDMVVELMANCDGPKLKIVWLDPEHTVTGYSGPYACIYKVSMLISLKLMEKNHRDLFAYIAEKVYQATRIRMKKFATTAVKDVAAEVAAVRRMVAGGVDLITVAKGYEDRFRAST